MKILRLKMRCFCREEFDTDKRSGFLFKTKILQWKNEDSSLETDDFGATSGNMDLDEINTVIASLKKQGLSPVSTTVHSFEEEGGGHVTSFVRRDFLPNFTRNCGYTCRRLIDLSLDCIIPRETTMRFQLIGQNRPIFRSIWSFS